MTNFPIPNSEIDLIYTRLETLCRDQPDLAGASTYYRAILPVLKAAQALVMPLAMDTPYLQQKLEKGQAILRKERLPFTPLAAHNLAEQICDGMAAAQQTRLRAIRKIQAGQAELPLVTLMDELLNGEAALLESTASGQDLDLALLRVIVQNCLKPFVQVWAAEASVQVDLGPWKSGKCPFCGSAPVFAELHSPQRARYLRCGLCGASWPFNRLQCAQCESIDTRRLGLLGLEGKTERWSVQTCDACHGYLKMMVTTDPLPADLLMIEDLSSLQLDLIAGQHGYTRPG